MEYYTGYIDCCSCWDLEVEVEGGNWIVLDDTADFVDDLWVPD
jgi:hypothetical protein